jgi:hypothetical protein
MDERDAHSLANKPIVKERDPLCVAAWIRRIVLKQLRSSLEFIPNRIEMRQAFFKNKEPRLAFRTPTSRKQGP